MFKDIFFQRKNEHVLCQILAKHVPIEIVSDQIIAKRDGH
jgi:hypothetical protein